MGEWRTVRLGDVAAEVTVGHVGRMADQYQRLGVPFLRSQNVRPHRIDTTDLEYIDDAFHASLKKSALRAGDVVTVRTGSPGQSAVVPGWLDEANCSDLVITRPGPLLDARWLSYQLNWLTSTHIASRLVGAVQQHFNVRAAKELELCMPGVDEQRAIAEVLGALDDKIAANTNSQRLSATLTTSLYRHAVDADSLSVPFFRILNVDFGEAFKGDQFASTGEGQPLIRIRDLTSFEPQVWTVERRPAEVTVAPGDVVVGMDGEFRATWWLGDPGLLNQRVCRVHSSIAGGAFVAEAIRGPLAQIEREKTATTVIHLNKSDLERSSVRVPAPTKLTWFEGCAEPVVAALVSAARENRVLARTRDELLSLLLSGKLRVKDAAAVVSDVV